jgi:hypothetical protein
MTHDLIDRMVRQANPVPDPKVLEPMASVLDLQRRTEVQTQNRIELEPESKPPRRNVLIAIAAIVAVILGLLFFLRAEDTDRQVVDQPEIIVTTTASDVVTTTSPAANAAPSELEGVWYIDEGNQGISRLVIRGNTYSWPQVPGAGGQIWVTGDLIEVSNAPADCPGVGIYRWSIEGTTLTFTPVQADDCNQRQGRFTAGLFTRNSTGQPDSATTTAPVEGAAPPELEGVWSTDLGGTQGINRLIIRGTTYNLTYAGVGGSISVDGDLIEFSDNGFCGVGVYRWLIEGDTLTFTAVEPPVDCSERRGFLVGGDGVSRVYTR